MEPTKPLTIFERRLWREDEVDHIAKTIRQSINQSGDSKFLESWLASGDNLLRKTMKNNKLGTLLFLKNEIEVNSNFKYDWASLVDFGYTDKCRFYTSWAGVLFLRIFCLNPEKYGNEWLTRDRNGFEVSFRMEKKYLLMHGNEILMKILKI